MVPSIIVGTETESPPRMVAFPELTSGAPFMTEAETLQDGVVTLLLELDESKDTTNWRCSRKMFLIAT